MTLDRWIEEKAGLSAPLTADALAAYQLKKLNESISYARARCSFYAKRLPGGSLSSLSELSALPFTTADDLRAHGKEMLCVRPDEVQRIVTLSTSGSTGRPKRLFFTREDQELTVDYFHHGMATLISPGETVLILFPGESPGSMNDLLRQGLHRLGCRAVLFGYPAPERYEELIRTILHTGASCLIGSAGAVAGAAEWSRANGFSDAVGETLHCVLLAADFVPEEACKTIRNLWRCTVHEHYGSTESGLGGALSCAAHAGYHTQAGDLYFEIIDPESLRPVPEGSWGEIVCTTLTRTGMPLIRYRTGDHSRFLPGPCPCGSVLPRLDRVRSRPQAKKFDRPDAVTF